MKKYLEQLFSLEGRVAIVNGDTSELSLAIVRGLARSGAIVCGTNNKLLDFSQLKTAESGANSLTSSQHKFQFLCDRLCEKYSKFDLLVNLEEIDIPSSTSACTDSLPTKTDNLRQEIETQIDRANQASLIAAPKIKQSGGGSILNIIQINNPIGTPDELSYVVTKNALRTIAKQLAINLIKDNIRVNNIVIGYVPNPIEQETVPPLCDRLKQNLVATAVYLASESSSSTTGQDIFVIGNKM